VVITRDDCGHRLRHIEVDRIRQFVRVGIGRAQDGPHIDPGVGDDPRIIGTGGKASSDRRFIRLTDEDDERRPDAPHHPHDRRPLCRVAVCGVQHDGAPLAQRAGGAAAHHGIGAPGYRRAVERAPGLLGWRALGERRVCQFFPHNIG